MVEVIGMMRAEEQNGWLENILKLILVLKSGKIMENYATKMRQALSDKNICKPDGSINHQYFLVKKG